MSQLRVALIVDHPHRDLAGALLIAFELCQRGYGCHIVPLNLQDSEIMALRPDFVLLNYLRMFNYHLGTQLSDTGIRFGMLDTEGGVWDSFNSYTELLWRDRQMLHQAGAVCMWGPRMADHVTEQGYFRPGQVSVTGCSRFDFYHPAWKGVLSQSGTNTGNRFRMLVNTNFSVVNPRFTTPEKSAQYCHEDYGWSWENIRTVTRTETQAIAATIGMVRTIMERVPGCDIVVRPHPFENPEPYKVALGNAANVQINIDGPVQTQIEAANVVIQRSCTTAIESVAAGVPTLSPRWIPAPYLMPMAEAVSVPCESSEELIDYIEAIRKSEYTPTEALQQHISETVRDWFHSIDGLSHSRVCDAIEACLKDKHSVDDHLCRRYLYGLNGNPMSVRDRIAAMLRYHLRLSPDFSFHDRRPNPWDVWTSTAKHLDVSEAAGIISRIEQAARRMRSTVRAVKVSTCQASGDYRHGYHGFSLSVNCL